MTTAAEKLSTNHCTGGQWKAEWQTRSDRGNEKGWHIFVNDEEGTILADIPDDLGATEARANVHVMASAKDMHRDLSRLLAALTDAGLDGASRGVQLAFRDAEWTLTRVNRLMSDLPA